MSPEEYSLNQNKISKAYGAVRDVFEVVSITY